MKMNKKLLGVIIAIIIAWTGITIQIQAFKNPKMTETELFLNIPHSARLIFKTNETNKQTISDEIDFPVSDVDIPTVRKKSLPDEWRKISETYVCGQDTFITFPPDTFKPDISDNLISFTIKSKNIDND